jgi:hypothetical protein
MSGWIYSLSCVKVTSEPQQVPHAESSQLHTKSDGRSVTRGRDV